MYWVEAVRLLLGVLCELWLLLCLLFVFRQVHKSGFMQKKRTLVLLRCIKALPSKSKQANVFKLPLKEGSASKNKRKCYVKTIIENVFIY